MVSAYYIQGRHTVFASENILAYSCRFFWHRSAQLYLHLYDSGYLYKYECGAIDDGNHCVPYRVGVGTGYSADVQRQ